MEFWTDFQKQKIEGREKGRESVINLLSIS